LLSLKKRRMVWLRADARLAVTNSCASCNDHAISYTTTTTTSHHQAANDWRSLLDGRVGAPCRQGGP
jgi:hypothetical protein